MGSLSHRDGTGAKQQNNAWQPAGGRINDGRLQMLHLSTLAASLAAQQQGQAGHVQA